MRRRLYPGDHADTAYSLTHLAATKLRLGDDADAERLYTEALEMRRRLYGDEHPDIAASLNNVGNMRLALGDLAGAERYLRESLQMISRLAPPDSLEVSHASNNLARVLLRRGTYTEALDLYRTALRIREARLKPDDGRVWASRIGLALSLLADLGEGDAATDLTEQEIRIEEGTPAQRAAALVAIAERLMNGKRWGDAAAMLDGALLAGDETADDERYDQGPALIMRAACAVQLGSLAQAESLLGRARPIAESAQDPAPVRSAYRDALATLLDAFEREGRQGDAVRCAALSLD